MHKRGLCRHAVSVHPSVTFVDHVKTNKDIFKIFSPPGSHTLYTITIDRVYITARLDVMLKTTEQNRIVCTSKSEAEVTNNKKTVLEYCTIDATKLTTDRHEASRGLFATAELLVDFRSRHILALFSM